MGFVLLLAFLPAVGCAMQKMVLPPPLPPSDSDSDRLQESLFSQSTGRVYFGGEVCSFNRSEQEGR